MQESRSAIAAGQAVRVRGAAWRVFETASFPECVLVALDGIDATNRGRRRRLLHPFDRFASVEPRVGLRVVRRRRWMHALRTLVAGEIHHDHLVSVARAAIVLLPYQLEPAIAVLRLGAPRLLLADEVGLGKTVQAGLILAELRARGLADRTLVLTPSGLREQWAEELSSRFRLDATLADAAWLRRAGMVLPAGVNPWETVPVAIASLDFVKRPEVIRALEPIVWDLVVVDEAHRAAGPSDRGKAVRALAARARRVVLVTATPHAGDAADYESLCDVGRLAASDGPILLFRRSRAEVGLVSLRHVRLLRVRRSPAEARLHALVDAYTSRAWREAGSGEAAGRTRLALVVLQKRALSSASALARSVRRRLGAVGHDAGDPATAQPALPLDDPGLEDGESECEDLDPTESLDWPAPAGGGGERARLEAILTAAVAAAEETKLKALARLLRRAREPALVFTEYRDTALYVAAVLAGEGGVLPVRDSNQPGPPDAGSRIGVLHGGLGRVERLEVERRFARQETPVLIATDVGSEGLNLQASCRLVVSLELPWNPMRLEQRIGRVDRIGQSRPVHAVHLVAAGTGEERILARLAARLETARREVGYVPDVLGLPPVEDIEAAIVAGARHSTRFARSGQAGGGAGPDRYTGYGLRPATRAAGGSDSELRAENHEARIERPPASLRRIAEEEVKHARGLRRLTDAGRHNAARSRQGVPQREEATAGVEPPARVEPPSHWALRGSRGSDRHNPRANGEGRAAATGTSTGWSGDRTLVTCLRHARLAPHALARLPPGMVCLFRVRLVDDTGHLAESLLEPLFVRVNVAACRNPAEVRARLASLGAWRAPMEDAARQLAARRAVEASLARGAAVDRLARRQQAVAARVARDFGRLARPIQAGLFDRRAERAAAEARRVRAALDDTLRQPGAATAGHLAIAGAPELALVLLITP